MLKSAELCDPASCLSRAGDNEMVFVLLARDAAAPAAIVAWCEERVRLGKNTHADPQIIEALRCAETMIKQREAGMPASGIVIPESAPAETTASTVAGSRRE